MEYLSTLTKSQNELSQRDMLFILNNHYYGEIRPSLKLTHYMAAQCNGMGLLIWRQWSSRRPKCDNFEDFTPTTYFIVLGAINVHGGLESLTSLKSGPFGHVVVAQRVGGWA